MANKKKVDDIDDADDTKNKKLDPKAWEASEDEPELPAEVADAEDPVEAAKKKKIAGDPTPDDDVIVVPEPPRDSKPRGPRDAIWSCGDHETTGYENRRPECRISTCVKPTKLKMIYEEKQRRAKDPLLSA